MSDKTPDPEARYIAVSGFITSREPGGEVVNVYPGMQTDGKDPFVARFPEAFKLDPEYVAERQRA